MYRAKNKQQHSVLPHCVEWHGQLRRVQDAAIRTHTRPVLLENDSIPSLLRKKTVFFLLAVHRPIYCTV